ncbi:Putative carbohydrate transporter (Glucose transport protein) [Nostocoides japonicum T1-X7]|uniref:Putative carbohydrate transporter (Glucose transport protein) n=1 Tax=Nostocoides japonicum T1-X7 TaxID=1194083 RepID=A0A077LZL2_9MICO|nr:sugar porter family MFS transporter [Tetrasphaera japonica]CCH79428.1 Putative carbohydrate transporter (Glucose transport protein) [Tetrasphaera japonica T1-X7]
MSEHAAFSNEESYLADDDTSSGKSVIRIASVAALGGLLFGYDSAVINGAVSAIQDQFNISAGPLGFAVASVLIGAAVGAMGSGRVADHVGRLMVMKIAAVLFFISAIGAGLSPNIWVFVLLRVVGGLGIGAASVIAPAYIAEIAPPRIRGRLGSMQQLAIVTGIFLSLLVDFLLAKAAGGSDHMLWLGMEAWRWMFIVMVVPAGAYGLLALTIPESPRYLVARHRIPEARKVLTALMGEKNLEITISSIQRTLDREKPPSWRDLKGPSGLLPIVWVGLFLSIFQQFVGINVIFYYSNVLWEAVGFSENDSFIITVITSVVNILTTLIAIATVDRVGRKPLLLIGSAAMTVALGVMAVIFGTATVGADGTPQLNGAAGPIALIAANVFVIGFGMSWGPVVWVLLGEMFPNRIRAAALSLAAAGQWVANWLITVTFPSLKDLSLGVAYGFYGVCALLSLLFVARFVRETKGRTLEDMDTTITAATPDATPEATPGTA